MTNALSIDVEEYFHPAEVQRSVSIEKWSSLPSRIGVQTSHILELLDRHSVRATFFLLGWVAEHSPAVVRQIAREGHEIGCHSYAHQPVYRLTPTQFRQDTIRAVRAIEDVCGVRPRVYRAPNYSITNECLWALEILVECGFECDSSIVPITHDRCGIPGFSRHPKVMKTRSGNLLEVPVGTIAIGNGVIPAGGGAYLRLLPYRYMAAGIRRVNMVERKPVCLYFHPWEIDAAQPRLASGMISRLRTYTGLSRMEMKLDRLMEEFRFSTLSAVYSRVEEAAIRRAGIG